MNRVTGKNLDLIESPAVMLGLLLLSLLSLFLSLGILSSLAPTTEVKQLPLEKSLAVQQVIDDINYARTLLAISSNDLITIEFSDSDNDYSVYKGNGTLVQDFPTVLVGLLTFLI